MTNSDIKASAPLFALLYCTQLPENRALPRRLVGNVPENWRGLETANVDVDRPHLDGSEIECFMAENLPDILAAS